MSQRACLTDRPVSLIHIPNVDRAWRVDCFTTFVVNKPWTITGPFDASLSAHFFGATGHRIGENSPVGKPVNVLSVGPNDRTTSPHSTVEKIDRNCLAEFNFVRLTQTYPHLAHDYPYHFY